MAWRVARSLDVLLGQLNSMAPNRSKAADGSIGDAAHQAQGSYSDHNPWVVINGQPVVTARDFTHDPINGLDCHKLATALAASRDPRIKYLIWQGRIMDSRPGFSPWTWQPSSGHYHHLHLSVMPATGLADDPRPWDLGGQDLLEELVSMSNEDLERFAQRMYRATRDALRDHYTERISVDERNQGDHDTEQTRQAIAQTELLAEIAEHLRPRTLVVGESVDGPA